MFNTAFDVKNFSNEFELKSFSGENHNNYCACTSCSFSENKNNTNSYSNSALTTATFQTMAKYLSSGYWSDTSQSESEWNLGNSGSNFKSGKISYSLGNNSLDNDGLYGGVSYIYKESFKLYEETLGIDFYASKSYLPYADIDITDNADGAYAASNEISNGNIGWGELNISKTWVSEYGTDMGSYLWLTVHHEIGHLLGLGHLGNYNSSATYPSDAKFANDSWQVSMMSYFSQGENTTINADDINLLTPSAVDWIALDNIYSDYSGFGVSNAFNGDTTFGFNTNISSSTSEIWSSFSSKIQTHSYCIVDGSGNDTLDLSELASNDKIDLRPTDKKSTNLYTSDIAGLKGNLHIAAGTFIENCISGSGNDELIGNNKNNNLKSGSGNDILIGGQGKDKLTGGKGNDKLIGGKGKDKLIGGKGKDIFKLSKGKGYDFIQDFQDKQDKIFIGSMKKLKLKNKGNDVYIYQGSDLLANVKGAKGDLSKKGKYFV